MELSGENLFSIDGDVWSVEISLYNADYPELNEGIFEEYLYDTEEEAYDKFESILNDNSTDWDLILSKEESYYDTIGLFVCCALYERGQIIEPEYFQDTIVKTEVLASR